MQQKNTSAANVITNWTGTTFLTSILGGALGDAYWGRLWTSIFCQVLYVVGLVMFSITGTIITADTDMPKLLHVILLYTALYITGVGNASLTPNLVSLGADQFDLPKQTSAFISMNMASSSMGLMFSTSIISYIENEGQWILGFWLSAGIGILGLLLLLAGMPMMRQHKTGENPLLCITKALYSSMHLHKSVEVQHSSTMHLCQRVTAFRWLDKATASTKHYRCTMEQLEAVKSIFWLIPYWVCGILVASVLAQKSTLFVLQGDTMESRIWGDIKFPPASMSLFSLVMVVIGAPAYTIWVEPCARRYKRGSSLIGRMGAGLVVAIVMCCIAAIVEAQRLRTAHPRVIEDGEGVSMSIFWLVPQYVLEGFTTALWACGHLEFNYMYGPQSMRSLTTALSLSGLALGNYLSSVLVDVVTSFTAWIPSDLNEGHLDYFYWLLAGLLLLNLVLFVAATKWVISSSELLRSEGRPAGHEEEERDLMVGSSLQNKMLPTHAERQAACRLDW